MNNTTLFMRDKPKIFFPNLDGLRFVSFILVFFSHSMGKLTEANASGNALIDQPLLFIFGNGNAPRVLEPRGVFGLWRPSVD